jgi:hypothetical protein
MKISELPNVKEFIELIFDFLKTNKIQSSLRQVEDYDSLCSALLNSEYQTYQYNANIHGYHIDFEPNYTEIEEDVYFFIFGNESNGKNNHILFDYGLKGMTSFIGISFYVEKHLPIVHYFIDSSGKLVVSCCDEKDRSEIIDPSAIMTFDELKQFLKDNSSAGKIVWVEVE